MPAALAGTAALCGRAKHKGHGDHTATHRNTRRGLYFGVRCPHPGATFEAPGTTELFSIGFYPLASDKSCGPAHPLPGSLRCTYSSDEVGQKKTRTNHLILTPEPAMIEGRNWQQQLTHANIDQVIQTVLTARHRQARLRSCGLAIDTHDVSPLFKAVAKFVKRAEPCLAAKTVFL